MIEQLVSKVREGLSKLDAGKLANMEAIATIDFREHFTYQSAQSLAFASGRIDLDTAKWLYSTLGGSADHFNRQTLADRLACLHLIGSIAKD